MLSYPDRNHQFLFSLPGLENVDSARKHMIRRVYDACIYSLFSGDVEVARKAYGLLLRCKEFKWKDLWSLGIHMLNPHDPDRDNAPIRSQVEQLRFLMVRNHTRREELLNEVLQVLVENGRYTEALDEIELYTPLFPYQDNPVLHTYSGLIRLYMSQESDSRKENESPDVLLQEARASFTRVIEIDPENCAAPFFLDLIASIQSGDLTDSDLDLSKDEVSTLTQDNYMIGNAPKRTKRGEHVVRRATRRRYEDLSPLLATQTNDD